MSGPTTSPVSSARPIADRSPSSLGFAIRLLALCTVLVALAQAPVLVVATAGRLGGAPLAPPPSWAEIGRTALALTASGDSGEAARADLVDTARGLLPLSLPLAAATGVLVFLVLLRQGRAPTRRVLAFAAESPPAAHAAEVAVLDRALARIGRDLQAGLTGAVAAGETPPPAVVRAVEDAVLLVASARRLAVAPAPSPRLARVGVADLLGRVVDHLAAAHPGVTWRLDTPESLSLKGDEAHLFRILVSLGRNAAQVGARSVALRAERGEGWVFLDVIDDGPGVDPLTRDSLFQAFAGPSRPGAAGVGLAVARDLARAQGGDLALVDGTIEGATFRLSLPAAGKPSS
ncbi:histidine kinase [Rhodospirillum rubrum]|uniref:ATP-binding protein n=1 Tax=Rhodospirillum rubrum TaxID=1085 RepID=UPI001907297D|nr:HAMP domain-containing sensor histidine kinase [Rhodospirillum rubrum]MBK1664514.1 histidine kinase [Rhodospirillum rubrum]MBK1676231.1 histidine kinase [Rhodospirillum rubrum]